jgi:mannose-6-phosphate isomerase-like protein (cupin superfamily)
MIMNKPAVLAVSLAQDGKYQRLLAGCPQTYGIKSGHILLGPGNSVGEHTTDVKEEVIIITRSKAQLICSGDNPVTVTTENIIYIPPETRHDIRNIGEDVLEYVYVVASVPK